MRKNKNRAAVTPMREEIIRKVRQAGVVGAGGAGFPTHAKLACGVKTIVVNAAECEPLLRVDQQLMEFSADRIIRGLEAVMKATGAAEGIIATKGKYKAGIAALQQEIQSDRIRLHLLPDFYPAGDEHVTVWEVTGRLVPQGGIPLQVDCVVNNVETLVNVAEALDGNPVTHTYLTVTGEVPRPYTCLLPIGTPVAEAVSLAGLSDLTGMRVIDGGPMMGKMVGTPDDPITKTTKGLIVLPADHPLIRKRTQSSAKIVQQAQSVCIQCRYCTDLCPRFLLGHNLEPHKIMRAVRNMQVNEETMKMALTCTECGICEQYACFMALSPRTVNAMLKQELVKKGIKPNPPPTNQRVHPLQEHRKIPVKRLIARLGLSGYDKTALLCPMECSPTIVRIPLKQHVGAPAKPAVEIGASVRQGELIAKAPEEGLGANVHASVSGTVVDITDKISIVPTEGGRR